MITLKSVSVNLKQIRFFVACEKSNRIPSKLLLSFSVYGNALVDLFVILIKKKNIFAYVYKLGFKPHTHTHAPKVDLF